MWIRWRSAAGIMWMTLIYGVGTKGAYMGRMFLGHLVKLLKYTWVGMAYIMLRLLTIGLLIIFWMALCQTLRFQLLKHVIGINHPAFGFLMKIHVTNCKNASNVCLSTFDHDLNNCSFFDDKIHTHGKEAHWLVGVWFPFSAVRASILFWMIYFQ